MTWLILCTAEALLRFTSEFSGSFRLLATSRQGVITGVLSPYFSAQEIRCAEERAVKSTVKNYCSFHKTPPQHCDTFLRFDGSGFERVPAELLESFFVDPVKRYRTEASIATGCISRSVESRRLHKSCIKTSPQQTDPPTR
jgi:hypothetical protein